MSSSADALNVLTEKLRNTINEIQDRYESFIDSNQLYRQGKINEREFFASIGDYLVASSAMNFITVQAIFEMRSIIQKKTSANTQPVQLSPASSTGSLPGTKAIGNFQENQTPRAEQQAVEVTETGHKQKPSESSQNMNAMKDCTVCGKAIPKQAKFCSKCGNAQ